MLAINENSKKIQEVRKELSIIDSVLNNLKSIDKNRINDHKDIYSLYFNKKSECKEELRKLRINRRNILKIS